MRNLFGVLLLAVLVSGTAADCSDGTKSRANTVDEGGAGFAQEWQVLSPNPSHVLVFLKDQGTIAHKLYFVEFGKASLPSEVDLPASFVTATLASDGKQLDCTDDKGKAWSFVIDGATSVGAKVVLAVKGLTEMNDPSGWDLSKSVEISGSGWDLAGLLQVKNPGTEPAPAVGGCSSGGPGSTSCSQTIGSSQCSTCCGGGYYACCYMNSAGSARCPCVPDQNRTK